MAGQLTFTKGPQFQGDQWCKRLASTSFPVPLSPRISTGTFVPATFSAFVRASCIAGERPKIMASGGSLPVGTARDKAGSTMEGILFPGTGGMVYKTPNT